MEKFEFLEITGSYKDLGRAIGNRFKLSIQKRVQARKSAIKNYDDYLKRCEPYFKATNEAFPNLISELTEIAKAAGVGVPDYFSINNREVVKSEASDHCTVAVSFGKHGAIVGHNEDWENSTPDALYILKATVGHTTFFGLQYKVTIPGVSVTLNNWGLTQCINELNTSAQPGIPKNFLARAIIECKSLDEAEHLIRNTKRASGFNHVLVQGREVRNIEIAGNKLAVQKLIGEPFVHTNHYLTNLKDFETSHTKSSEARYLRANILIKRNMNAKEMESLLSDRNGVLPISRPDATIGSVVIVPNTSEVRICYGPPVVGKYKIYEEIINPR